MLMSIPSARYLSVSIGIDEMAITIAIIPRDTHIHTNIDITILNDTLHRPLEIVIGHQVVGIHTRDISFRFGRKQMGIRLNQIAKAIRTEPIKMAFDILIFIAILQCDDRKVMPPKTEGISVFWGTYSPYYSTICQSRLPPFL